MNSRLSLKGYVLGVAWIVIACCVMTTEVFADAASAASQSKLVSDFQSEICAFKLDNENSVASRIVGGELSLIADKKTVMFSKGENWFSLALASYGREGKLAKAQNPEPAIDGTKLNLVRNGMTEWYVNHGSNFEHGLVLNDKPAGTGKLNFIFATKGSLTPEQDEKDIVFTGSDSIYYSGIKAWDASGKMLSSAMSVADGQLLWSVDDSVAEYPVYIDPTISITKRVSALNTDGSDDGEASAHFGIDVAVHNDIAIVGADDKNGGAGGNSGAAYIYYKDQGGSNNWGIVKKLLPVTEAGADDTQVNGYFGTSVAVSGDTVVVGAYGKKESTKTKAGAAYVFQKNQGGTDNWGIVKKLTAVTEAGADDTETNMEFAWDVSISGDLIVAGGYGKTVNGKARAGAMYLFSRDQGGTDNWGIIKVLTAQTSAGADDSEAGAIFGDSVCVWGDLVATGASRKHESGLDDTGAVYVYSKDQGGTDSWGIVKKLLPLTDAGASDLEDSARYGWKISFSGDTLLVSARERKVGLNGGAGAAYIYSKDLGGADNWGQVKKITALTDAGADDSRVNAYFGDEVSLSGDYAFIGAPENTESTEDNAGAAYIYYRNQGGSNNWGIFKKIIARTDAGADDATDPAEFGDAVSSSGNVYLVGAPNKQISAVGSGAAYFYTNPNSGTEKTVVPVSDQPSGTTVTINSNTVSVMTRDEVSSTYQAEDLGTMLGSNVYAFTATSTSEKTAYFAFNCSSLGERRAGDISLFKLFTNRDRVLFNYIDSKTPASEGFFWITDGGNSDTLVDRNTILTGGRSYTINYSITDNGVFDTDRSWGSIADPVVPGISNATVGNTGCVLNPAGGFGLEWLLLAVLPMLVAVRSRFKK